jgi:UDP-GlcNAc3NAcA epimerase
MEELLDKELIQKLTESGSILIIPPAGFLDIIALEKNARIIISDSGGLQKESFFFQKPCVILREQTEWVEIVENGNALLAGSNFEKIIDSFNLLYNKTNYSFPAFYGEGDAASFICQKIVEDL